MVTKLKSLTSGSSSNKKSKASQNVKVLPKKATSLSSFSYEDFQSNSSKVLKVVKKPEEAKKKVINKKEDVKTTKGSGKKITTEGTAKKLSTAKIGSVKKTTTKGSEKEGRSTKITSKQRTEKAIAKAGKIILAKTGNKDIKSGKATTKTASKSANKEVSIAKKAVGTATKKGTTGAKATLSKTVNNKVGVKSSNISSADKKSKTAVQVKKRDEKPAKSTKSSKK